MIREIPYGGWTRCLELDNGHLRLIATLEVGPRILFCGASGGPNLFKEFPSQAGKRVPDQADPSSGDWLIWGGHRLWVAPEAEYCYLPDNQPVRTESLGTDAVRLIAPDEAGPGWRREIDLHLQPGAARVRVVHRLVSLRDQSEPVAPWALSVMDAGGTAHLPQPALGSHPEDLLPNRNLVVWPYVRLDDPRFTLGLPDWTIQQRAGSKPFKIGLMHRGAPVAYVNKGYRFSTTVPWTEGAAYPDYGVNCEIFTNGEMLEVETLAPLKKLRAGETAEHAVEWEVAACAA